MRLVKEISAPFALEDESADAERIIKKINALVSGDITGERLLTAQALVNECRDLVTSLTKHIYALNMHRTSENIVATSKYLKLQSRLTIAAGLATKHVAGHLRVQAANLKRFRNN